MEDFTTYPDDFLYKSIIFNEEDNGEYAYCLLHNDFNRLVNYAKAKYNYNDAQYNHLEQSFTKDLIKYLN